jgi:hypothetical protein
MPVSIYEWEKTVSGWDWIEVTSNKVINLILRELNNLIKINSNNEVYVDLQLDDNLQSTSTIPVGVNVWRVLQANGFPVTWTLITAKTTSWDIVKVLYWDDGKIRVDNGTGTWEIIQYEMHAGVGISIDSTDDFSAVRWPCPEWWHIPSVDESLNLENVWQYVFIAPAWQREGSTINTSNYPYQLRTRDAIISTDWQEKQAWWTFDPVTRHGGFYFLAAYKAYPIRAFKDVPVVPDETWTELTPSGAAYSAYYKSDYNPNYWIISYWTGGVWTTIMDRNLWATTIYEDWDTLSEANCGYYYQWGNNYWFPWIWSSETVTVSNTRVDVTDCWPSTYSSSTFIVPSTPPYNTFWGTPNNLDLWGMETGIVHLENVINNTWVLSVNWQTGNVIVSPAPWLTYITWSPERNEYSVAGWDFKNGDLILIDCSGNYEPTTSITIQWETYDINGYDVNNWWNWSS